MTNGELIAEVRHRFSKPTAWDLQRDPLDMSMAALTHSLATRLEAALARVGELERSREVYEHMLTARVAALKVLKKQRDDLLAALQRLAD